VTWSVEKEKCTPQSEESPAPMKLEEAYPETVLITTVIETTTIEAKLKIATPTSATAPIQSKKSLVFGEGYLQSV
jgi:hypothetical protein